MREPGQDFEMFHMTGRSGFNILGAFDRTQNSSHTASAASRYLP